MQLDEGEIRILLVEDNTPTREELVRALRDELGEKPAVVHQAGSVSEALARIQEESNEHRVYDIALLDFRLPRQPGGNPEGDTQLCPAISGKNRHALVVHMTAYSEDPTILQHIAAHHGGAGGTPLGLVDKNDPLWIEQVATSVKAHLAGQIVRDSLAAFFGPEIGRRLPATTGGRSLSGTRRFGRLFAVVVEYWAWLDPVDRRLILEYCEIEIDPQTATITDIYVR